MDNRLYLLGASKCFPSFWDMNEVTLLTRKKKREKNQAQVESDWLRIPSPCSMGGIVKHSWDEYIPTQDEHWMILGR